MNFDQMNFTGNSEPLVAAPGRLSVVDSHRYSEKRFFFPRSLLGEVLLDVIFEQERVMEETRNNSENAIALSLKTLKGKSEDLVVCLPTVRLHQDQSRASEGRHTQNASQASLFRFCFLSVVFPKFPTLDYYRKKTTSSQGKRTAEARRACERERCMDKVIKEEEVRYPVLRTLVCSYSYTWFNPFFNRYINVKIGRGGRSDG